jgi:hypothetical protein
MLKPIDNEYVMHHLKASGDNGSDLVPDEIDLRKLSTFEINGLIVWIRFKGGYLMKDIGRYSISIAHSSWYSDNNCHNKKCG